MTPDWWFIATGPVVGTVVAWGWVERQQRKSAEAALERWKAIFAAHNCNQEAPK